MWESNTGTVGTITPGASVTTGAGTSTKGTAVQLIAATAFDAYWVTVVVSGYGGSTSASDGCLDILAGAATEEVIIPNLLMGGCGNYVNAAGAPKSWSFPLYIPAGTRLAAQAAGRRTATAMNVCIYLYGGTGVPAFRVGGKVTTYTVTTVPNGVAITPGASGAEGAWTEMTASTSEDHFAFVPSFQVGNDTTQTINALAVDVGVGAATEEEMMGQFFFKTDDTERISGPSPQFPIFQDVPASTRLVMRASNSGINDSAYDGAIHAVS
jgi:hypothetical protein